MQTDLLALGRQIANDPTCHELMIGDPERPVTNQEMAAYCAWVRHEIQQRISRDGCCGGEMSMSGRCPETGHPCPMYMAAKKIERQTFHKEQRV